MKFRFILPLVFLMAHGCIAQQPGHSFTTSIKKDFKRPPLVKNNTLIFLRQVAGNATSSGEEQDSAQYLGEFPIDKISVFSKKDAVTILRLLSDQAYFFGDETGKSCAFIPTHVFLLSNNSSKIIAYSASCEQLAIFSADLKRLEAIGNLNAKGNEDVSNFIKSL